MLGGNEFCLRRGFAYGKTLVRLKSATAQKVNDPRFSNNFIEKRRLLYPKAPVPQRFWSSLYSDLFFQNV